MGNYAFLFPREVVYEEVDGVLIIKNPPRHTIAKTIKCTCGLYASIIMLNNFDDEKGCPSCGGKITKFDKEHKSKMFSGSLNLIERDGKNFKLEATRYKAIFKKDNTVYVKDVGVDKIEYSNKRVKIQDYRGVDIRDENRNPNKIRNWLNDKFSAIELIKTIARDEDDFNYRLFVYNKLKNREKSSWYGVVDFGYSLAIEENNPIIEKLYKSGFEGNFIKFVVDNRGIDKDERKLHKALGIPKATLRMAKKLNSFYLSEKRNINELFDLIDGHNFNAITDIMENETIMTDYNITDLLSYLKDLYQLGYTNITHLANYVCRVTKLQQGLDSPTESARLLKDYVVMMKDLGYEYEKYPSSLKKVHDIAVLNKNILANNKFEGEFGEVVKKEDYIELEFKDKVFSIVAPKESQDLIKEGKSLSHCVASYVKDVSKGICKVLFFRMSKNEDESYMTIEVRNNEVKQFRGYSNRPPAPFEIDFLKKWAEKKNIIVTKYSY